VTSDSGAKAAIAALTARCLAPGCFALALLATLVSTVHASPIALEVDASDVADGVQHAHLVMSVHAGPLTLAYPEWIPGEHRPNGPITQVVNLQFVIKGQNLRWRRDPLSAFLFHLVIPPGASTLDVTFDYVSPTVPFGPGFGQSPAATPHLVVVLFNQLLLYAAAASPATVKVHAKVRIPQGWSFDSPLTPERIAGPDISLPATSLDVLVDSPLLAGEYVRTLPLTEGADTTRMTIAADSPKDLPIAGSVIASLRRLPGEAQAVFGPGHYRRYVWQVALSRQFAHDGLEHHESSDVREEESLFTAPEDAIDLVLFPHEYVHSWNGKYRRPRGLVTRNYQQPMSTDLLWIYEGLTRYYGDLVLAARSGLISQQAARAYLAFAAAQMDEDRPGRRWRSLADTATSVPAFAAAPAAWTALRRGADYYNEMLLVWMEADTAIRLTTNGGHSLDDFCAGFFSGPERTPTVKAYSRSDVVKALSAVAPRAWDAFLAERIDAIAPRAPLGGLHASGWDLLYDDGPNPFIDSLERKSSVYDFSHSLGMWIDAGGTIQDVVPGSPAFEAGAVPGLKLSTVSGDPFTITALRAAIVSAETARAPIELRTESSDRERVLYVNHYGGLRNPHLVRDSDKADVLSRILAARVGSRPEAVAQ
jgi:predicted metalloprotease with PDZ domain